MNIAGVHPSGGGFPREFVVVWSTTSSGTGFGSIRAVRYDAKNNCCIADITDDGNINVNDLLTVINQWSGFCLTCSGDVDGDLAVNVNDLLAVINAWGPCGLPCPPLCAPDITGDCLVNVNDLLAVINAWGPCP
jgi:hypothetical protein